MASEYLKWKYRDVQPEKPVELTKKQRRQNWWHYHKWHVLIGAAVVLIGLDWAWNVLTRVTPDYQIAYVGSVPLAGWETRLAALGTDRNGDGKVVVRLNQYLTSHEDAMVAAAANVKLLADLDGRESCFFLLEDPEPFQTSYHVLRRLDGTQQEEGPWTAEGTYFSWNQCPVLAGLELGEYSYTLLGETVSGDSGELVSGLYLARRGFWTEKTAAHPEGCAALWEKLTEGAVS